MATKRNIDADKRCKSCKTTNCLKRHCSCFAGGYYCDEACFCEECFNRPDYQARVDGAREYVLLQNPNAFSTKEVRARPMPSVVKFKVGCQCRMTKCLKDRCKCYKAKVECQDRCVCVGCDNIHGKRGDNSGEMIGTSTRENSDMVPLDQHQFMNRFTHQDVNSTHLTSVTNPPYVPSQAESYNHEMTIVTSTREYNLDLPTVEQLENWFAPQDFNERDDDGKL